MTSFIKSLINRLFPSRHQIMVSKWWADGGDYAMRFNYPLGRSSIVLDLGGYEGQWASDIYARYRCKIYVFEPVVSFAENIRKRFFFNDDIEVFDFGLAGDSRSELINVDADGSSVFGSGLNSERIKLVDVVEWVNENLRSDCRIDLMKVNIEGGEYELLDRLISTNIISRIDSLQVQFHEIPGRSYIDLIDMRERLSLTHCPVYQYDFVWEEWKKIG